MFALFIPKHFENAITSPKEDVLLSYLIQILLKSVETIGIRDLKF